MSNEEPIDDFDESATPGDGAPFNAGHRGAVRKRKQKVKMDDEKRNAFLAHVLANDHGRAWLAWLIHEVCGLYAGTENAAFDTNSVHFKEGARAVALILQNAALSASPDNYILLIKEHLKPEAPKP